jgi:hypothetical protein
MKGEVQRFIKYLRSFEESSHCPQLQFMIWKRGYDADR